MKMIKIKTADLIGAQLDYAVAMAGEEWKTAHRYYPTMTLDPTFGGVEIIEGDDYEKRCFLTPNNPMRQGWQHFFPSTLWEHGGPIIEREHICLQPRSHYVPNETEGVWDATIYFNSGEQDTKSGPTPLIAAMRAYIASKLGDEVEVPA